MSSQKNIIKAPKNLPKKKDVVTISGDEVVDGLFGEALNQLEEDRREADDLFELIRQNAEMSPDDPQMSMTAVQALRVKHAVSSQAIRVVDIAARYKIQKEKLDMQREDGEGELLDLIDEENEKNEDKNESDEGAKEKKGSEVKDEDRRDPERSNV